MPNITLLQPSSLPDALSLLAEHGDEARIVAGGTALVLMIKNRLIAPSVLLSLGRVNELNYIRHEPGIGLKIGALATVRDVESSDAVREKR